MSYNVTNKEIKSVNKSINVLMIITLIYMLELFVAVIACILIDDPVNDIIYSKLTGVIIISLVMCALGAIISTLISSKYKTELEFGDSDIENPSKPEIPKYHEILKIINTPEYYDTKGNVISKEDTDYLRALYLVDLIRGKDKMEDIRVHRFMLKYKAYVQLMHKQGKEPFKTEI